MLVLCRSLDVPLGRSGDSLHEWLLPTRSFQEKVVGKSGGTTGPDDDLAAQSFVNLGAWIMGRNMFGPVRGDWPDGSWKGWWGDNPPYHRSEEHTSELQSLMRISYAVFCLKKKNKPQLTNNKP